MKITIVQPDILWEDRAGNLHKLQTMLKEVSGKTDLVILPEMFSTGFSMQSGELSEAYRAQTYQWMENLSQEGNYAICGSYIVKESDNYLNRFVFIAPDRQNFRYDKRHLFSIGGEDLNFTHGNNRLIINFKDYRINAIICYDLRFPVWIRNRNDYDLLICVANWPESRREVWNTLLKARAIENQCYVVGVNRVGTDNSDDKYAGESMILDPKGRIITAINEYEEGIATGEISLSDLQDFRLKFPVWKDADDFTINI
jgi:predicted amidohydrolase